MGRETMTMTVYYMVGRGTRTRTRTLHATLRVSDVMR